MRNYLSKRERIMKQFQRKAKNAANYTCDTLARLNLIVVAGLITAVTTLIVAAKADASVDNTLNATLFGFVFGVAASTLLVKYKLAPVSLFTIPQPQRLEGVVIENENTKKNR